ncbi:MAG: 50S ribosomal protein L32e [Euryarchaeota archaeon]|nr:50S ribosomal protein L32e [Euryarchaeota archaeon]MBT4391090.1 50S ribosomal protein L32e [Euryarchaeota archaeon]MBT4803080.1 50S ribosomal protein L32e [Euryarchaeota archaeon]MBT6874891.1 50S ribosomal protein L32e [Euryarchaeota archaeon]
MTVAQLKDLLRENDLSVSGKKSDLINRLSEIDTDSNENPISDEIANEDGNETSTDTVTPDSDIDEENDDKSEEFFEEDDNFYEDFDGVHTARQKPVLDEETKANLKIRSIQKKKQPAFRRQEWFRYKRLSHSGWRKPKGYQSKQRLNMKYRSPMARIGFGKIAAVRGLHSSGFEEVLVHQIGDMDSLNPELQAIRIGSTVGNRKRIAIHARADDLGVRVLNRRNISPRGDLQ